MKFSNKAGCTTATRRDIEFAARQKSLVAFEIYGGTYGNGGIGRTDRGDVAYHDLAEYDSKPMLSPQENLSVALPFSFIFLVIESCFSSLSLVEIIEIFDVVSIRELGFHSMSEVKVIC